MLPDRPGTYVLIMRLPHPATVRVGRLGSFSFPAGWYTYAGSACGPGGLRARIARHLRWPKPRHWHVDYLRDRARPAEAWYTIGAGKRECAWARALCRLPGASTPVPGFGASDCRCATHLVHFAAWPNLAAFASVVDETVLQEELDAGPA